MIYQEPNTTGSLATFKSSYDNYIGGKWVAPKGGEYFEDIPLVNGKPRICLYRTTRTPWAFLRCEMVSLWEDKQKFLKVSENKFLSEKVNLLFR